MNQIKFIFSKSINNFSFNIYVVKLISDIWRFLTSTILKSVESFSKPFKETPSSFLDLIKTSSFKESLNPPSEFFVKDSCTRKEDQQKSEETGIYLCWYNERKRINVEYGWMVLFLSNFLNISLKRKISPTCQLAQWLKNRIIHCGEIWTSLFNIFNSSWHP